MKSKLAFTAVFFLVFCMSAYGIEVSAPQLSAAPGDVITVEISVDDATGMAGGDIKLVYDATILAAKEVRATALLTGWLVAENLTVAGEVTVSMAGLPALSGGTGPLLEVDFEALAAGESPLTLAEASFSDETAADIPTTVVDGSVTVQAPGPELPTPEELLALHEAHQELLNAHDMDQYLSSDYETDDVIWDYVPIPTPMPKEETKAFFEEIFQGFPDFQVTPGLVLISGNIIVEEHVATGTHMGEWMGIPATENSVQFPHIDIWEFEVDKIKRATTYVDMASVMVQLGVMPAPELDPALLVPSFTPADPEPTGLTALEANAELVARWNAHDVPGWVKMMRTDVEILDTGLGVPVDRNAYAALGEQMVQGFSDTRAEVVREIDMGDGWVAVELVFTGTHDGSYLSIPATGLPIMLRAAGLRRFDADGLVTNFHLYYDNLSLLTQLGLFPPPPDTEANKAMVERRVELENTGNLAIADEIFASDYVGHDPSLPEVTDLESLKGFIVVSRAATPDQHTVVEDMVAEGDKVAVRLTATGTHTGEFMGIPPSGAQVTNTRIHIFRFAGGKIVESWSNYDMLGVMEQIGVVPPTREDYAWGVPSAVTGDPGEPEANKEIVRRVVEELWNQRNIDLADEFMAAEYVHHDPTNPTVVDLEGYKQWYPTMVAAFPDGQITIDDMVAEGDLVAKRYTVTGTHTGAEVFGIPATGNQFTYTGITIYRIADGKIVETWWSADMMGLLQQLTPPPPEAEVSWVVVERLAAGAGMGPEDIAFDAEGRMYASMEGGIMRFQPDGTQPEVFAQTPGRPLGLRFDADGNLIVCDGQLFSVAPDGTVTMLSDEAEGGPITKANGLDIAADGTIYFADTTNLSWEEEIADQGPRGRLLAYDPATGTTSLVLGDLWFANGVAISPDQSFVLVGESFVARVTRYWLTGTKQGESEVFLEGAAPDNLSTNPRGMFWVSSYFEGALLEVDTDGNVVRKLNLLYPSGKPYAGFTGAREREGMLYLSNNQDDAIGRLSLEFPPPGPGDYTNIFFMTLTPGLNMISVPLEPVTAYTARSLAERLSATVVIRYDEALRKYSGFTLAAPDEGFAIEGGKGYIVNAPEGGMVTFVGAAWTNEPPAEAAPPTQSDSAWAFVVSGSVLDGDGMSTEDGGYTLTAKNLRTGVTATETVDTSGYSAAVWADLSRKAVIEAGDEVEVAVVDSSGKLASGPFVHEVTLDEIRNAVLDVRLRLGHIIPEKMALLQNYPNPFNPETWIPFHLSDEASVSIRIYNATGQLIRTLDLGHKDAGVYVPRSKAAYWDGKNEAGEAVASGIYFYNIAADDFSATRKMVIRK